MTGSVWLHSTDPAHDPGLTVLAMQLDAFDTPPEVIVTGQTTTAAPPLDDASAVDAFLDQNAVRLLVLAGAAVPVALIDRARAQGAAVFLVDAQHPVLPRRWRLVPGQTRAVLSKFTQIHTVNAQACAVLSRLVRSETQVFDTGRLAQHGPVPGCNASELESLRSAVGARPVWFAYDLPDTELDAALLAHAHALRRAHRLLMILQPRDATQGAGLAQRARDLGFACARRSLDEDIDDATQVYIADTDDNPGLFLRLAPVAFLGGSLTPSPGSPSAVIAAALGSALIFGPHSGGPQQAFLDQLQALGGGRQIGAAPALGDALAALLAPDVGAEAALKAWTLATDGSDATNAVARAIMDWMQLNRGRA